jgi:hypothetical protein
MTVQNKWQLANNSNVSPGESISPTAKKVVKAGATAAGVGISAAQHATNAPTIALLAAGAAASATGIGLVVAGAAATLTMSALSATSAYKSWQHCKALDNIHERRQCYACKPVLAGDPDRAEQHNKVADAVLPYLCLQKSEKTARKAVGAVPTLGAAETVYAIGRSLYKRAVGTRGVKRTEMASILAEHLITHDCGLAQAIVADLYSFEKMQWLLMQDHDEVARLLAQKMASR